MSSLLQPAAGASLDWAGLHNARDLGGHLTPQGRTRYGAVVRSEAPTRLTAAGRERLREHGITGFVDLRSEEEAAAEPSPFAGGRGYRRVPILDRPAMQAVRGMRRSEDLLRFMVFDRTELIGEALLNVLDLSADGGVLIHCRVGKDRTGVVAALLLLNAGVDPADVAADHARSEANLEPLLASLAVEARTDEERAEAGMRRFAPTPDSLLVALREITERHGSVPRYLREIGLTTDELAALRLLLTPSRRPR
jgi:protein-tyrosine phosphatase